jgi:hypothetical protein
MSAKVHSRLAEAIETLYKVFGKYPLSTLGGCPCCVTNDDKCQLTKKGLRILSSRDLGRYCGKAMTTWGSVSDFKHFLPRIFELVAYYQAPYEEFTIFNKLNYGEWTHWPETEKQALFTYFQELWEFVLEGEEAFFHDYFVAIAFIFPSFEELLARWQKFTSATSIRILASEIYRNNEALFNNNYFRGPFFTSPEYSKLFRQWVRMPKVKEALLQAIEFYQDERTLTEISVAYELIEIDIRLNQVL